LPAWSWEADRLDIHFYIRNCVFIFHLLKDNKNIKSLYNFNLSPDFLKNTEQSYRFVVDICKLVKIIDRKALKIFSVKQKADCKKNQMHRNNKMA